MRKAGKMDLVLAEDNLELAMWTRLLRECYSKVTPNVSCSCRATCNTPQLSG